MSVSADPTLSELLASVQRTLAESIRVQREATERLVALKAQMVRLLAENAALKAEQSAVESVLRKARS